MEKKFIIKCFDGDIYIITGYNSQAEIETKLEGLKKVEMPNGDRISVSGIDKIQSYESYTFQADQKKRHKQGQFLKEGKWYDNNGEICNANLEKITGALINIPKLSTPNKLTTGKK